VYLPPGVIGHWVTIEGPSAHALSNWNTPCLHKKSR
jgi:hypothetical protein